MANENNLQYEHIRISQDSISEELVERFRNKLENAPKPVLVHCASGKRAGAMVMMHLGCQENMSGEEVLQKAKEMGFECDVPELEKFVTTYVNNH